MGFAREEFVRGDGGPDFTPNRAEGNPPGLEIGSITEDVEAAYRRAVDAGCTPLSPPTKKPWGQVVSLVRDDEGVIVEISSPWSLDG